MVVTILRHIWIFKIDSRSMSVGLYLGQKLLGNEDLLAGREV